MCVAQAFFFYLAAITHITHKKKSRRKHARLTMFMLVRVSRHNTTDSPLSLSTAIRCRHTRIYHHSLISDSHQFAPRVLRVLRRVCSFTFRAVLFNTHTHEHTQKKPSNITFTLIACSQTLRKRCRGAHTPTLNRHGLFLCINRLGCRSAQPGTLSTRAVRIAVPHKL